MDENEIKQELQDALDKQEHTKNPDEIIRPEDEIVVDSLFEEEEEDPLDGDS